MKLLVDKMCGLCLWMLLGLNACVDKGESLDVEIDFSKKEKLRFTELHPNVTNILFSNYISENEDLNIVSYEYLYNGGGVAIGDINNDSLPDVMFTATMVPNKMYLNLGGFKFKDITYEAGLTGESGFKTGITFVDINNDNLLDIYVCRTGKYELKDRSNLLYINQGNNKFEEQAKQYGIASSSYSNHATFFDYDNDGDLDLFVLNHPVDFENSQIVRLEPNENGGVKRITSPKTDYDSDQLFRNNGDGTFTDVTEISGISNYGYGLSVSIGDFNSDGYEDIFVANDYVEPDKLYINNRDGTFSDQIHVFFNHISQNSMGSDYNDFDNDGLMDLVVVDMIAEGQERQKSLMTSMIYERYHTLLDYGYQSQQMRNVLQRNNNTGSYSEIGQLSGISNTDWSWAPLIADFDNNGLKDLFISNGYKRDLTNCDYTIHKSDSLKKADVSSIYEYLSLIPSNPIQNYMFANNGDLTFSKVSDDWGFTKKTFSNGAAYGDLDNDGDLDLIINNLDQLASVYRNETESFGNSNYIKIKLSGTERNSMGIGTKVTLVADELFQVQKLKTTRGFFSSVEPIVHFGMGNKSLIDSLTIDWGSNEITVLRDVQANQTITIDYKKAEIIKKYIEPSIIAHESTKDRILTRSNKVDLIFKHQENKYEDFRFEPLIPHKFSNLGPLISIGDINMDGLDDLFIGGAKGQSSAVFIQEKGKKFRKIISNNVFNMDKAYEDLGSLFFDADGDGDKDLYVTSGGNESSSEGYQDRLYINTGTSFERNFSALPRIETSTSLVLDLDYDNDGDLDLFVGGRVSPGKYPISPNSYILRNDDGVFIDVTEEVGKNIEPAMFTSGGWIDLENNGEKQLILAGEWTPIMFFKFIDGEFKEVIVGGLTNSNGWWNTLEFGDFDNDGDIDFVGGNLGMNSKYKASSFQPFEIFAKDFDNNGFVDPIMTHYIGDKSWPVSQKNSITKHIPILQKRFLKYEKYSSSTIYDIFTEKELEGAFHKEVKTFKTTYFENLGKDGFEMNSLPVLAQVSPIFAIEAFDVDNDGNLDLILGGNQSGTEVERGPYDASKGLLLMGLGNGVFEMPQEHPNGLNIDREVRDIKMINIGKNKDPHIIISTNNDSILIYEILEDD